MWPFTFLFKTLRLMSTLDNGITKLALSTLKEKILVENWLIRLDCYCYIMFAIHINCALPGAVDTATDKTVSFYGTRKLTDTCYRWISAVTK